MRGAVFVDSQCFYRDVTAHYSECSNNNIILLDIGGSTTGGGRESIDGQELTHQGRGPVCWRGIITLHVMSTPAPRRHRVSSGVTGPSPTRPLLCRVIHIIISIIIDDE